MNTGPAGFAYYEETLGKKIREQIGTYSKKRKSHRLKSRIFEIAIIVCSAATTLCLSLHMHMDASENLEFIGLCLTILGTVLATLTNSAKHKELWIRYTLTANRLRALEMNYRSSLARRDLTALEKVDYDLQSILSSDNDSWLEIRADKASE